MNVALLALAAAGLVAQAPAVAPPLPPASPGGLPLDAKDKQPLLLGETTAQAILEHRATFRTNLAKVKLSPKLKRRWQAIKRPFTLVAVFGSWCADSRSYLPDLLALEAEPNPFIEVHFLGVYRDKQLEATRWPEGCPPQKVVRVPTFYLFGLEPGGGQKLLGSVEEYPPRTGQSMAQALVELVEGAAAR